MHLRYRKGARPRIATTVVEAVSAAIAVDRDSNTLVEVTQEGGAATHPLQAWPTGSLRTISNSHHDRVMKVGTLSALDLIVSTQTNISMKIWARDRGPQPPWEHHHAVLVHLCQVLQQQQEEAEVVEQWEEQESTVKMDTPVGSRPHPRLFPSRLRVALVAPPPAA